MHRRETNSKEHDNVAFTRKAGKELSQGTSLEAVSAGNVMPRQCNMRLSYSRTYGSLAPTANSSGRTGLMLRHLASA